MKNERLTKENFWNDLQAKYPDGLKIFCNWIDEYKKRVDWGDLFSDNYRLLKFQIKYHDIPFAMQIGIWIEFVCEMGGYKWEIEDMFSHDWEKEITGYIKMIHERSNFK